MQTQDINKAIATALIKDRDGLIKLIKKNGVIVNSNYSDREIIIAVLDLNNRSDRFKNDLADFLTNIISENKHAFTGEGMFGMCGFTGENMFRLNGVHPPNGWQGADGAAARTPAGSAWGPQFDGSDAEVNGGYFSNTATTTAGSTASKDKLFNNDTIRNILNQGLNVLSTTLSNKSNKELANKALEIEQEKTKQAALLAARGGAAAAIGKPGMSTGAIIGIAVVSIVGLGLIIWAGSKLLKKHRAKAA